MFVAFITSFWKAEGSSSWQATALIRRSSSFESRALYTKPGHAGQPATLCDYKGVDMTTSENTTWYQAKKAPFEAFGILYYPLFAHRADLEGVELDDADMAWAVTANANLDGTGYTLSQPSRLT